MYICTVHGNINVKKWTAFAKAKSKHVYAAVCSVIHFDRNCHFLRIWQKFCLSFHWLPLTLPHPLLTLSQSDVFGVLTTDLYTAPRTPRLTFLTYEGNTKEENNGNVVFKWYICWLISWEKEWCHRVLTSLPPSKRRQKPFERVRHLPTPHWDRWAIKPNHNKFMSSNALATTWTPTSV